MRTLIFALFLCLAIGPATAQKSGLSFLRIGPNAEAGAMGDAQVAHTADAYSTFWNPAGLAAAERNSASLSYYAWVLDTHTYSAAARFRMGSRGAIGLFATAMGSGDLEARTGPGEPDGTFGVEFVSAGASYARQVGPIRAGVTAKHLTERIFTRTAYGYAVDVGLQLDLLGGDVGAGAVLQNVGKMSELDEEATNLPRAARFGVAVYPLDVLLSDDDAILLRTLLTAEVAHFFETDETRVHVGAAAELLDTIVLRGGYVTNDALRGLSLGLGFRYDGVVFDYAFVPFASGFEGPGHLLTMSYGW
ncbi:MAG: PorV/PorQ family protein [Rhodothermales bacterium]